MKQNVPSRLRLTLYLMKRDSLGKGKEMFINEAGNGGETHSETNGNPQHASEEELRMFTDVCR